MQRPSQYLFYRNFGDYLNREGEPREELFIQDKLHQNHDGYLIWGELVRKKLDEVLNKKETK